MAHKIAEVAPRVNSFPRQVPRPCRPFFLTIMKHHPIQPLVKDTHGTLRFKRNAIVDYLLEHGGIDMNDIAGLPFQREDREQFAQLIGYSLSGFSELSYVSDDTYAAAEKMAKSKATPDQARIKVLEATLKMVRVGLRDAASAAFRIHPDDLKT